MIKYDKNGKVKTVNEKTTTKYHGSYPEKYLEHCKNGGAIPQFCRKLMISRVTFDEWCSKYPEMMKAKVMGKIIAEGWWLDQAQQHLVITNTKESNTKFDTALYKHYMGGRFGYTSEKEFRDILEEALRRLGEQNRSNTNSAYAEHAECEPDSKTE